MCPLEKPCKCTPVEPVIAERDGKPHGENIARDERDLEPLLEPTQMSSGNGRDMKKVPMRKELVGQLSLKKGN